MTNRKMDMTTCYFWIVDIVDLLHQSSESFLFHGFYKIVCPSLTSIFYISQHIQFTLKLWTYSLWYMGLSSNRVFLHAPANHHCPDFPYVLFCIVWDTPYLQTLLHDVWPTLVMSIIKHQPACSPSHSIKPSSQEVVRLELETNLITYNASISALVTRRCIGKNLRHGARCYPIWSMVLAYLLT